VGEGETVGGWVGGEGAEVGAVEEADQRIREGRVGGVYEG
jgi:hypothetical protein